MAEPMLDRETILEAIRTWPAPERISLVQEVLDDLRRSVADADIVFPVEDRGSRTVKEPPRQRGSLRNLVGLLATDQPPPTDEAVERWLEEHRMEKYGS
jgi:hypothetical protein